MVDWSTIQTIKKNKIRGFYSFYHIENGNFATWECMQSKEILIIQNIKILFNEKSDLIV